MMIERQELGSGTAGANDRFWVKLGYESPISLRADLIV